MVMMFRACIVLFFFLCAGPVLAATSTMPVDANGNVGVGTTAPLAGLQVGNGVQTVSPTPTLGLTSALVKGNLEVDGKIYGDGSGLTGVSPWTTAGSNIYYSSGNVGIGTTSPNNTLQVLDLISFDGTDNNTKLGYEAGKNIVSGAIYNTFVGVGAGKSAAAGGTNAADYNTAIGYNSLFSNTTGSENAAVGANALYTNTTGIQNAVLGVNAAYKNTTGGMLTAIGYAALYSNIDGINNTAIGSSASYENTSGTNNVAVGVDAMHFNTTASYNTAAGYQALYSNKTGSNATAIGAGAMQYANDTATAFNTYNVAVGFEALRGSTTASANTGTHNTAVGYQALYSNTTGNTNTALGYSALYSNTQAEDSTAIGYQALYSQNSTAGGSTAIGYNALYSNATGGANVAVGYEAGRYQADGTTALTNPYYSVYIGYGVRGKDDSDSNSIVIGYNAVGLGANTVVLGNDAITVTSLKGNVGVGTTAPQQKLEVKGGAILGSEYALTTAASMTVNWVNGNQQYVTLNQAGHTISFSNYKVGQVLRLIVCQDATGGRTVTTWDSSIVWANGSAPTLTSSAGKCDVMSFVCGNAKGSVKNFGTVTANF